MKARPAWWCRAAALLPWVGVKAQPGGQGVCQGGAATRQGAREPGPIGPAPRAQPSVRLPLRARAAGWTGARRAWARAGVGAAQGPGLGDGPALEPTAPATGCGQLTRQRRREATRGQAQEIAVTVSGWHVWRLRAAVSKRLRAGQVGKRPAPAPHGTRAWVTPARARGRPGPGHSRSGSYGRPSGPYGPARAGSHGRDRPARDGGRGPDRADDR